MKITIIAVEKFLASLIMGRYFGKVTFHFKDGVITHVVKEESLKLVDDA